MVLLFSDLNEAQIFEMPYRDSPHHENEVLMEVKCLILLKLYEHTEGYRIRKPNDKNFLFEIGDKKYIYVGEKIVTFKLNDKIVFYSSDLGFNDIKYTIA